MTEMLLAVIGGIVVVALCVRGLVSLLEELS
jgi:hypothetical protein